MLPVIAEQAGNMIGYLHDAYKKSLWVAYISISHFLPSISLSLSLSLCLVWVGGVGVCQSNGSYFQSMLSNCEGT